MLLECSKKKFPVCRQCHRRCASQISSTTCSRELQSLIMSPALSRQDETCRKMEAWSDERWLNKECCWSQPTKGLCLLGQRLLLPWQRQVPLLKCWLQWHPLFNHCSSLHTCASVWPILSPPLYYCDIFVRCQTRRVNIAHREAKKRGGGRYMQGIAISTISVERNWWVERGVGKVNIALIIISLFILGPFQKIYSEICFLKVMHWFQLGAKVLQIDVPSWFRLIRSPPLCLLCWPLCCLRTLKTHN